MAENNNNKIFLPNTDKPLNIGEKRKTAVKKEEKLELPVVDIAETYEETTEKKRGHTTTKQTQTVNVQKTFKHGEGEEEQTTNSNVQVVIQNESTKFDKLGKLVALLVGILTIITSLILIFGVDLSGRDESEPENVTEPEEIVIEQQETLIPETIDEYTEDELEEGFTADTVLSVIFQPEQDVYFTLPICQIERLVEIYNLFEEITENQAISISFFDTETEWDEDDWQSPFPLAEGFIDRDSVYFARAQELLETTFTIEYGASSRTLLLQDGIIQHEWDRDMLPHVNIDDNIIEPIIELRGLRNFETNEIDELFSVGLSFRFISPERGYDANLQGISRFIFGDNELIVPHRSSWYDIRGERVVFYELAIVEFDTWDWSREYSQGAQDLMSAFIDFVENFPTGSG